MLQLYDVLVLVYGSKALCQPAGVGSELFLHSLKWLGERIVCGFSYLPGFCIKFLIQKLGK